MTTRGTRIVRIGDREVAVTRQPDGRLLVEGVMVLVTTTPDGSVRVEKGNGASAVVHIAGAAAERWVQSEGTTAIVEVVDARAPRRRPAADGALAAPMPATVLAVLAEAGQDVRSGDTLVMLEAMKMELPLRAPRDGRVARVHCRPGERVEPGVALVDLA